MASMRGEHSVGSVQNRTKPNGPKMEILFFFPGRIRPKTTEIILKTKIYIIKELNSLFFLKNNIY